MRKPILAALAALTLWLQPAQAYDIDTHFYETYLLARYAGIGHEVSSQMAAFNQWIDVSTWTSPMFPTLWVGSRMRRLFHFPDEFLTYNNSPAGQSHGQKMAPLQVVEENDPFGRELLMHGLKTGNMLYAFAGLHTHMDSFGHAGWSFLQGHQEGAHWPDRPWFMVDRHKRMTKAILEDMVAIRKLLPQSALDPEFRDLSTSGGDTRAHKDLSAKELAERYNSNTKIQGVIANNVMQDPRFTREAVAVVVETAISKKLATDSARLREITANNELYTQGLQARALIAAIITEYIHSDGGSFETRINVKQAKADLLRDLPLERLSIDEIGRESVLKLVVGRLTEGVIPAEPSLENRVQFETEPNVRKQEMKVRIGDWRELIAEVTGARIKFDSKTMVEKMKQMIDRWRGRLTIDEWLNTFETVTLTKTQRGVWMWRMFRYVFMDAVIRLVQSKGDLGFAHRWRADADNLLVAHEKAFDQLIAEGKVKQLLDGKTIAKLKERQQRAQAKAKANLTALNARGPEEAKQIERASREVTPSGFIEKMRGNMCADLFSIVK